MDFLSRSERTGEILTGSSSLYELRWLEQMKLLFLIHRLPCPPDGGSKLRAAAQLRYLAARHEVWCAGFVESAAMRRLPPEVARSLADLRSMCRDVVAIPLRRPLAEARALSSLLAGGTATEGYFASQALRRRVLRWSDQVGFDCVLAFSSSMAPLALQVPARRRVLDMDDLDSKKWAESVDGSRWPMSWTYRTEANRLARRERDWLAAFDASVLVSERERDLIDDASLRRRVHVIEASAPDGVASTLTESTDVVGPPTPLPASPIVGFVGAMDYGPNVDAACWFAESIWPLVKQRQPDAIWWLVGRRPARAVRRLAAMDDVYVTGTVPEVEPYLERLRVSVAPLRLARGVQIKVLMAMRAGRPCVVTPPVAEGIGARPGHELVVADSAASFADAVAGLLTDDRRASAIARAGYAFIANRPGFDRGLARLENLLTGQAGAGISASGQEEKRSKAAAVSQRDVCCD